MIDLGAPAPYSSLEKGTPVLSRQHKQVGTVHVVVADTGADAFDALVIQEDERLRVALAEEVESIYEFGVVLALDTKACQMLPEPTPEPEGEGDLAVAPEGTARVRLRRAWELISGGS
jgi:uncharacterized protein YrrD